MPTQEKTEERRQPRRARLRLYVKSPPDSVSQTTQRRHQALGAVPRARQPAGCQVCEVGKAMAIRVVAGVAYFQPHAVRGHVQSLAGASGAGVAVLRKVWMCGTTRIRRANDESTDCGGGTWVSPAELSPPSYIRYLTSRWLTEIVAQMGTEHTHDW